MPYSDLQQLAETAWKRDINIVSAITNNGDEFDNLITLIPKGSKWSSDYKGRNALDYWEPFEASMGQMVDLEAKEMYQKYQEKSNLVAEALKKAAGGKDERSTLHDDEKSVLGKTDYSLKPQNRNVAITVTTAVLKKGRG